MPFFDPIRIGASAGGTASYEVARSLRFERGDSAYLQRTAGSPTNSNKFSFSCWVKRTKLSTSTQTIMGGGGGSQTNTNAEALLYFVGSDEIASNYKGGLASCTVGWFMKATRKLRDTSSWLHLLSVWDGSQSGDPNRMKFFVNGIQESLGHDCGSTAAGFQYVNQNGATQYIGRMDAGSGPYYGSFYLAEAYFVDGTACTPSDFIETDSTTGQIIPKNSDDVLGALTMGNNGFYLNFSDNSDVTATTLGKDYSGNSNNWTPYNFSVSAGVNNDSVTDTPTFNKATLNAVTGWTQNATLSDGNLKMSGSAGFKEVSTIGFAGTSKFYYEVVNTSAAGWQLVGVFVGKLNNPSNPLTNTAVWGFASTQATYYGGSYTSTSDVPSWSNNDVMGIKYENGTLKLYKNGTLATATTSSVPTGDTVFAYIANDNTSATAYVRFNSDDWTQDSAAGVDETWELSSANLPQPAILLPNKYFDTKLYTGNGSTGQTITYDFGPDWVWMKNRTGSNNQAAVNTVIGRAKGLYPDINSAEFNSSAGRDVSAFTSNGFTVGEPEQASSTNNNGSSIVAWAWDAGETDGKTYTVTVVDSGGNKYRFDGFAANAVTLDLAEGGTYIFNYPSAHPFRFSTTSDGTYGGGSEYTTVVTVLSSTSVQIVVAASAPQLYYFCTIHSGMGGAINTNSTLGSSNFDGASQTTLKVNTTAGFSIVKYSGSGSESTGTIGHGLGVVPKAAFFKRRESSANWMVYHQDLGNTHNLYLNTTDSSQDDSHAFNDTSPTSTVFTLGISGFIHAASGDYIAFIFSEVPGFSKFSSYIGNGSSSDGTFVYLGFKPALIIYKKSSNSDNWEMHDSTRDTFNPVTKQLFPNTNGTESTSTNVDFLANGFKHYNANGNTNENGDTYVYFAWAESPFKNSRAR